MAQQDPWIRLLELLAKHVAEKLIEEQEAPYRALNDRAVALGVRLDQIEAEMDKYPKGKVPKALIEDFLTVLEEDLAIKRAYLELRRKRE